MAMDPTLRDALSAVTTGSLARILVRRGLHNCILQGLAGSSSHRVGPAVTLRFVPARGEAGPSLSDAIESVPEGAVVVVSTGGTGGTLPFGGLLAGRLSQRGAAALVVDGAAPETAGLSVWSTGPGAGTALVLAGRDEPVACAGAAVHPGDIVVADRSGIVAVPAGIAEAVALEAVEQQRLDIWLQREVEKGVALGDLLPPSDEVMARFRAETSQG